MKIVLDVYGGDHAPVAIVKGAVEALKKRADLDLVLTGKKEEIENILKDCGGQYTQRTEILDAPSVITNDDVPTMAVKTKRDSSLVVALDALKQREDISALVSAGSTGAVLAGGVLRVGRLEGVLRPALAPVLPNLKGGGTCLIDCGANMDCLPEFLLHFAHMGSAYMQSVHGIKSPRVALVSVGVEDKKGNKQTHEAFELLKNSGLNFVGNMEARDALSGDFDVLVCDGFIGNVLLKSVEGTASMVIKKLKSAIMDSASAKIGALFMKKAFAQLKSDMDYNAKGGAPLLGVKKVIVKSHGGSQEAAICASIFQACAMVENDLIGKIKSSLAVENA